VSYFCVSPGQEDHAIDLDLLDALPAAEEIDGVRHVRLPVPAAWVDGRRGRGLVLRGG
jgi:hypothetical protein